jgi:hypothetical protein
MVGLRDLYGVGVCRTPVSPAENQKSSCEESYELMALSSSIALVQGCDVTTPCRVAYTPGTRTMGIRIS